MNYNTSKTYTESTGIGPSMTLCHLTQQEIDKKVRTLPLGATHVSLEGSNGDYSLALRGVNHRFVEAVSQSLVDLISHSPNRWN